MQRSRTVSLRHPGETLHVVWTLLASQANDGLDLATCLINAQTGHVGNGTDMSGSSRIPRFWTQSGRWLIAISSEVVCEQPEIWVTVWGEPWDWTHDPRCHKRCVWSRRVRSKQVRAARTAPCWAVWA